MAVQLLSDDAYTCTGIYLTILGILAVTGNMFVLIVMIKGRPNFITIHTVLIYVIAVSDLAVSVTAYPLTAVSGYHRRWYFDEVTCTVCGFIVYFFTMCTMTALCVMAISRYFIVCRPDLVHYIRGKHITLWLIGIGLYALFWTGAPLLGWSSYGHEPFQTSCTVNWYGKSVADITYNALCIVFCYCVPVGIFVFCYYNVLKKSLQRDGATSSSTATSVNADNIVDEMTKYSKIRASRHMTYICLAMVTTFIIIWTPYTVMTFWNLVATPASSSVQVLPTMFAKLNCVANPVIYSLLSDRFREAAMRAFPCKNKVGPNGRGEQQLEQVDITVMMLEERSRCSSQPCHVIELEVHDVLTDACGTQTRIDTDAAQKPSRYKRSGDDDSIETIV